MEFKLLRPQAGEFLWCLVEAAWHYRLRSRISAVSRGVTAQDSDLRDLQLRMAKYLNPGQRSSRSWDD